MTRTEKEIENPLTGERIKFLKTATDKDGELLQLEFAAPLQGSAETHSLAYVGALRGHLRHGGSPCGMAPEAPRKRAESGRS